MTDSRLNRPAYIYALYDPRTDELRYIGATVSPIDRYYAHCNPYTSGYSQKGMWIRRLHNLSLAPRFVIIETTTLEHLQEAEQWWLTFADSQEWDLLNSRPAAYGIKSPQYRGSPIKPSE